MIITRFPAPRSRSTVFTSAMTARSNSGCEPGPSARDGERSQELMEYARKHHVRDSGARYCIRKNRLIEAEAFLAEVSLIVFDTCGRIPTTGPHALRVA